MEKRDKMLERARNLLSRAEHPNTPEAERELCYSRYNKLVQDWAIEEAEMEAAMTPAERQKPEARDITMPVSTFAAKWRTIVVEVCRTFRCRVVVKEYAWTYNEDHTEFGQEYTYTIVGFPSDIAFVEMLLTSMFFTFVTQLNPRWESSTSFEHNVYRFKTAGRKWEEIANAANNAGVFVPWPDGGRLIRAYKAHCKAIGEEPTNHTQRHGAYRESFTDGFVARLGARLEEMREAAESAGAGKAIVLRGADVDDLFYELYPHLSPEAAQAAFRAEQERRERERREREEKLSKMTEKQKAAFFAKEERDRQREMRANNRYWRQWERDEARRHDSAGSRAGQAAADKVDLSRTGGQVETETRRALS